ncbi:MAG: sigma-70 family RNA polymerase sigma factor [Opitutaceae bacterium]|nr:sigma-70 family RNA polymerase sigma factor [Opitutaceae bacterium]
MIATPGFAVRYDSTGTKADCAARKAKAKQEASLDRELVRRFNAEGDEAAFAEIMARYRDRMFSVAFAMLKNYADAEEIAQDAFIRAHRGLATFRGDSSLGTWLHQIALNLARNRYWYHHRRRRHLMRSLETAFGDDNQATFSDMIATDAAGPVREAVTSEFSTVVSGCMERLGVRGREVLTLRTSLNRSYIEIAGELGISVGTVKSRIARARERLRLLIIEACPEFGADFEPLEWFDAVRPMGGIQILRV